MDNDRNYANMSEVAVIGAATSVIAAGVAVLDILRYRIRTRILYIPRAPHVNRDQARENYINSILYASSKHCIGQIRMSPMAFSKLCDTLTQRGFVQPTIHMTVREQVMIFLHIVGHNVRFRVIGSRFHRSTETIHRYFLIVLNAILKLYPELVRLPSGSTPSEIRNNRRFYPWFSDCVGAIDGTHIRASVPMEHQGRFRGRKGMTSQNVLAVVTFDLKFAYVLAGWEGSAHDSCVLNDALSRPEGLQVPEGKYYLANASYGIRRGFIPPFRGVRYHLKEYSNHEPENEKELVNHRHSSLRTTVERGFGVLKKRFRVLGAEPFYKYELQVDVVLACCVPHNFIMEVDPNDRIMRRVNRRFQPRQRIAQRTQRQEREESREWTRKKKAITDVIERGLMLGVEIVTDRQLKTHAKVETLYVMEQMNEMGVSDIPLLLPTPLAENKDISRIVPIIQTFFGALIHLLRPKMQKVMKRYNDGWNEEYKKICCVHDKDSDDSNDMPPSLGEELFARDESGSKSSSKSSTSSDAGYGKEDYEDYDEEFEGYGEEYKD